MRGFHVVNVRARFDNDFLQFLRPSLHRNRIPHRSRRAEKTGLFAHGRGGQLFKLLTVGSSPKTSSPTSASAIACRIFGVGLVTVSLLKSEILFMASISFLNSDLLYQNIKGSQPSTELINEILFPCRRPLCLGPNLGSAHFVLNSQHSEVGGGLSFSALSGLIGNLFPVY
jgi:hypothetical protein